MVHMLRVNTFGLLNAGSLGMKQDEIMIATGKHSVDVMAINDGCVKGRRIVFLV